MVATLALVLGAGLLLGADHGAWELVGEEDGVRVYSREVPGSDVHEVKAVVELAAPSARVWEVVRDSAGYKDFMPYLEVVRVVRQDGPNVHYVYQMVDAPMLSRRDCVVKVTLEAHPERGLYVRRWQATTHAGPPPSEDMVRLTLNAGSITVESTGPNQTRLSYQVHAEPGGSVPTWLANRANKSSVPDIVAGLRKRVERDVAPR